MSDTALPCPFCGTALTMDARQTGFPHPTGADCILSGWFFGKDQISRWNTRAAVLYMEGGEKPSFNEAGRGRIVGAEMLNRIVDYYEGRMRE